MAVIKVRERETWTKYSIIKDCCIICKQGSVCRMIKKIHDIILSCRITCHCVTSRKISHVHYILRIHPMNTENKIPLLPTHKSSATSMDMDAPTQPSAPRGGFKVTDLTVNIPSSLNTSASTSERRPAPSRWGTLEFKIYYLVFMVVVPIMIWIPVSLSSRRSFHLYHRIMVHSLLYSLSP